MHKVATIKKRADFLLAASSGFKFVTPTVIVQSCLRPPAEALPQEVRVGYTVTRKVGNAVVRNRAKRRLRAAAAQLVPALGAPSCDYVLIGRMETGNRKFTDLLSDLRRCLKHLSRQMASPAKEP